MHGTPPAKLRARLLFDDVAGPTERSALPDDARTVRYQPRELICDEGSPSAALFVILEGRVELFLRRGNGSQDIYLDVQGPGEYFGELGLFDGRSRSASAIATLPTTCKLIGKESLRAWLFAHPSSAIALLTHASFRIRDLSDELRASMSSAYERVSFHPAGRSPGAVEWRANRACDAGDFTHRPDAWHQQGAHEHHPERAHPRRLHRTARPDSARAPTAARVLLTPEAGARLAVASARLGRLFGVLCVQHKPPSASLV
jgi:CRP-like cAMP-binding protein